MQRGRMGGQIHKKIYIRLAKLSFAFGNYVRVRISGKVKVGIKKLGVGLGLRFGVRVRVEFSVRVRVEV